MAVRARNTDDGAVMTVHRRVGSRAPLIGLMVALAALLLLPTTAFGADWTKLERVSSASASRLDSMHQLTAARGVLHLVHPRVGPRATDDRVFYQRSVNKGRSWSAPKVLFKATRVRRTVVANLAVDARNRVVAVAFRVRGPRGTTLFVRTSENSGRSFGPRVEVFSTSKDHGVGVPAVAIGNDVIAVAWTNRANGRVKIRTSRDGGRSFGRATTVATTKLSIDCDRRLTDGLVGLAISGTRVHLAWSHAPKRACYATAIRVRTSTDRGRTWSPVRTITEHDSFGWPELDARENTVVAAVQGTRGEIIFARSGYSGRKWRDHVSKPPKGRSYSAADVALGARKSAWLSYVNERIKNGKLVSTRVVTRRSSDDGASYGAPRPATRDKKLLRQAANVTIVEKRPVLVVQSGALDGSPRHIYSSRYR